MKAAGRHLLTFTRVPCKSGKCFRPIGRKKQKYKGEYSANTLKKLVAKSQAISIKQPTVSEINIIMIKGEFKKYNA